MRDKTATTTAQDAIICNKNHTEDFDFAPARCGWLIRTARLRVVEGARLIQS